MKPDFRTVLNVLKETAAYRVNTLASFLVTLFPMLFLILFWEAAFSERESIAGFGQAELIAYYLIVLLLQDIIVPTMSYEIVGDIRSGKLASFLIRPFHYLRHCLAVRTAVCLNYLVFSAIVLLPIVVLFFGEITLCANNPLVTIAVLVNSFLLAFLIGTSLSLVSFWLENTSSIDTGLGLVIPLASGAVLPLAFFPDWLRHIVSILPFRYTLAFATEMTTRTLDPSYIRSGLLSQGIWMVVSFVLLSLLWKLGRGKYSTYGG